MKEQRGEQASFQQQMSVESTIFSNKTRLILLVVHSGFSLLQNSVCMSILNPISGSLPDILGWSVDNTPFLLGLVNSANTIGAAVGKPASPRIYLYPCLLPLQGSVSSAYVSAKLGRRKMFIIGDILNIIGSLFCLILNTNTFIIGRFICGIGMGFLVSLATLFVIEWTHEKYRGYAGGSMVCFSQLGMLITGVIGLLFPHP